MLFRYRIPKFVIIMIMWFVFVRPLLAKVWPWELGSDMRELRRCFESFLVGLAWAGTVAY